MPKAAPSSKGKAGGKKSVSLALGRTTSKDAEDISLEIEDEDGEEDFMQFMNLWKKTKTKSSGSASVAFTKKQEELHRGAKERAEGVIKVAHTDWEQARQNILEWRMQDKQFPESSEPLSAKWDELEETSMNNMLSLYSSLLSRLAPERAKKLNEASYIVETYPDIRAESRKIIMHSSRKRIEEFRESEKVNTEASKLISDFKALLRSSR